MLLLRSIMQQRNISHSNAYSPFPNYRSIFSIISVDVHHLSSAYIDFSRHFSIVLDISRVWRSIHAYRITILSGRVRQGFAAAAAASVVAFTKTSISLK